MSGIRVTSAAHRDFVDAVEYLFEQGESLAEAFISEVDGAYQAIAKNPRLFARLETNPTNREVRRHRLHRFAYLVIYEMIADEPIVLAIMHASRHPDAWRRR